MNDSLQENIKRLADGSIDLPYYAEKGAIARNRELTLVARRFLNISSRASKALGALAVLLMI